MRPSNVLALDAVAVSGTTAYASAAIECQQLLSVSAHCVSTSTATGAYKLQASNDPKTNIAQNNVPTNWFDIPSATQNVTAGSSTGIPKTELSYEWIRVVYTNATNTGSITIRLKFLGL